jgi:polyferredoxin
VVLLLLVTALGFMLVSRDDVDVTILRTAGSVYQTLPDGRIGNVYNAKLANKTHKDIPLTLQLENIRGEIEIVGKEIVAPKEDYKIVTFILKVDPSEIKQRKTPISFGVYQEGKKIRTANSTFMGPAQ